MDNKATDVVLGTLHGIHLILERPSGIFLNTQTGGYSCHQRATEGVLIPIASSETESEAIQQYFVGPKWQGWCSQGIDLETADYLDSVFESRDYLSDLRVDRYRLADSEEAWIHVRIRNTMQSESEHPHLLKTVKGFPAKTAVLIWENSD